MADDYTVLTSKALEILVVGRGAGATNAPFGRTATAVLPDNTFLVGCWYDTTPTGAPSFIRVWHLGQDLTILGQVDVPGHMPAGHGDSPVFVVCSATSVLMVSQYSYGDDCYSWMLDCSGATPVVGALNSHSSATASGFASYQVGQPLGYYQPATNVVALACWDVRTFQDGVLKASAVWSGNRPAMGMWPDPKDANKLTVVDDAGRLYGFQIDAAGAITTFTPAPTSPVPGYDNYNDWLMAAGDPNDPNAVIYTEDWPPPGSSPALETLTYTGTRSAPTMQDVYTVAVPAMARLDQRMATFGNVRDNATGNVSSMRLVGVNWTASPATFEIHSIGVDPYLDPNNTDTLSAGGPSMAVNTNSGLMVAASTFSDYATENDYSLLVWAIQGPGNAPNLTATLQGVEVHFAG